MYVKNILLNRYGTRSGILSEKTRVLIWLLKTLIFNNGTNIMKMNRITRIYI